MPNRPDESEQPPGDGAREDMTQATGPALARVLDALAAQPDAQRDGSRVRHRCLHCDDPKVSATTYSDGNQGCRSCKKSWTPKEWINSPVGEQLLGPELTGSALAEIGARSLDRSGESVASPWPELVPFTAYNLPPFPALAFPAWMRNYAADLAVSTQTPTDLPFMLCLVALAAAFAKVARVAVNADWTEPLNLFVAVVLPPATRKSAVFSSVMEPLTRWEKAEAARLAPERRRAQIAREMVEGRLKNAKDRASKANNGMSRADSEREILAATEELEKTIVPPLPKLVADDATPEKLVGLMRENGGRIALLSPEGGVFEMMAGRYQNKQPNLDVYLKGHAGDDIRVDRVGRDSEFVEQPALTLGLAIQPVVLESLRSGPSFRGKGMIARFSFSLPPNNIGMREIGPPTIPQDVRDTYSATLGRLLDIHASLDPEQPVDLLTLGPGAWRTFVAFQEEIEPRLAGDLCSISDWAGKLCGAVARVAGLLHLASETSVETPISGDTMTDAVSIGRYLIAHARAAFAVMGAVPEIEGAKEILKKITSEGWATFSRRDAQQALRARFEKVEDVDEPLTVLVERGFIRLVAASRSRQVGRPPSPQYEVRSSIRRTAQNPQNPQMPPPDPSSEGSEESESQASDSEGMEERAAIMEEDGGLMREEEERRVRGAP